MKIKIALTLTATLVLLSGTAALAQATGTAHPEELNDDVVATQPTTLQHYVKPSPAVQPSVLTAVHPSSTSQAATVSAAAPAEDDDAEAAPVAAVAAPRAMKIIADDDNSGVVINVPTAANELAVGTRLLSKLDMSISTKVTAAGTPFRAVLAVDTYSHGKVVLPQGTIITGRIAQIHGGRRISGPSVIQMVPESLLLPDGSQYRLHAQVSSIDRFRDSKVNSEGTIVSNSHGKTTASVLGFTTGTAAIAGALVGGGVGAAVGAGVAGGIGAVWWLKQDRQQTLPKGMDITFSLDAPLRLNSPVAYQAQGAGAGR
jgi:hypothetical protein